MAITIWRLCGRAPNSRQLLVTACFLFLFWCLSLYRVTTINQSRESDLLKAEIIRLSENYVRALARENSDIVDGPYAGRFTAYDLKKTIAVLLESMLDRIDHLEAKVNITKLGGLFALSSNSSQHLNNNVNPAKGIINAEEGIGSWLFGRIRLALGFDVINGVTEECALTAEDKQLFPNCEGKVMWMRQMWKSDPCYGAYGVDGSECSFVMYLSEVEGWCPKKAWRGKVQIIPEDTKLIRYANISTDIEELMKVLVDPNERQGYAWIRMRIRRMWPRFSKAMKSLQLKQDMNGRRKKKILVHLGLLSKQSGWKFAESQFKGGPLGELVQWSDLVATLFLLGHQLTITSEAEQLAGILNKLPAANSPCQSRKELPVDIIYTDIVGLRQFKKHVKGGYGKFSCLLRIVDSFGTEPAYNLRSWAKAHKILTTWGGQDLQPQQFFTMFPHSPDNSFMGFVVEQHLNDTNVVKIERRNQALVYGKNEYMWEGKAAYLEVIKSLVEIHGTVYIDTEAKNKTHTIPSYVNNHGLLNGEDLHTLLRQSKIFIGLGFPYEGPAPLEAIANGAVFINPKFNPPHSSKNTKFFKGKPTERKLTSQHPYAEQFLGEPYVYTIDIKNIQQVKDTVARILHRNEFNPYMPYEYTEEGMLQRMNAYIEHQNFCQFQKQPAKWPPNSAVKFILGGKGVSCKDACWAKNLICDPSHFRDINSKESLLENGATCAQSKEITGILYPSFNTVTNECEIQKEEFLFSCVGEHLELQRLCPCRNYIKVQTALCQGCEV
ncbi:alpha-1,6-mannosylglycoprotein 6-beta-N-acetylglucosaminyltransferase A-like isoform X4 [Mytilus edulis]|uniref:alpha-1,6-mannosylglycoprotein 6-beta-N-acetylglucosaminyltransferase A-like isoform X4 n=1 Tax=Mytilus edulis TaxID=6550 RepID=UPI0039EF9CEC